jgi:NADH-quinone oxidoreductase subunit M
MGFVTLGIFSLNQQGMDGAIFAMLSHSLVAPALFLGVAMIEGRLRTGAIAQFGGVATVMPRHAALFMLFALASIGLPGLSGFVGEFFSLQGAWLAGSGYAVTAALGVILSAAYMLWFYRRVFYGSVTNTVVSAMPDLTVREALMWLPLAALVLWLGVHPNTFRHVFAADAEKAVSAFHATVEKGNAP